MSEVERVYVGGRGEKRSDVPRPSGAARRDGPATGGGSGGITMMKKGGWTAASAARAARAALVIDTTIKGWAGYAIGMRRGVRRARCQGSNAIVFGAERGDEWGARRS